MTTVDAEDILRGMKALKDAGAVAGDADALPSANEFPLYRIALDLALGHCWRSEWWPELKLGEMRYFRANWLAGSTYNKTNEVYDAATQQYFQCLRNSVTGAGNSPTDSNGAERSSHWALCRTSYGGNNWASGVAYAVGTIVLYPVTNRFYQCHTAHTSSATLVPDATGGNERWGILTNFKRNIARNQTWETNVIGDVEEITDSDPETNPRWRKVRWGLGTGDLGAIVAEESIRAWVTFRIPRPRLKGSPFSATATYSVGQQVYWDNNQTIVGNFYNCITATSAGESPTSASAKWDLVEIPESFYAALVHLGAAKLYMPDGQQEKMTIPLQLADEDLGLEADVMYRQQGQSPAIPMRTYR